MKIKPRIILFRGKNVNTDKWVYGSFIPDLREVYYPNPKEYEVDGFIKPFGKSKEERLMVEVERETVGQFTGLLDRNGVQIFEGDIITFQRDNDDCPFPNKDTKRRYGRVFWQEWRSNFSIAMGNNGSDDLNWDLWDYVRSVNRVEVVGNCFDNPELLELI